MDDLLLSKIRELLGDYEVPEILDALAEATKDEAYLLEETPVDPTLLRILENNRERLESLSSLLRADAKKLNAKNN